MIDLKSKLQLICTVYAFAFASMRSCVEVCPRVCVFCACASMRSFVQVLCVCTRFFTLLISQVDVAGTEHIFEGLNVASDYEAKATASNPAGIREGIEPAETTFTTKDNRKLFYT